MPVFTAMSYLVIKMLQLNSMTPFQRKLLDITATVILSAALLWGFWSFFQGQAVYDLFSNDYTKFQEYLNGIGAWSWVVYVWLVMLEVLIAFIPGWFVYPVGGAIFGLWPTIILVTIGNLIGASVSFWIGRKWGTQLLHKFIAEKTTRQFDSYMDRHGILAVFLLKVNPVTSLDILNYVAGASPIKFWKFTIANILGILPMIIFSAVLGEETFRIAPQILGVLALLAAIYIIWFFVTLPAKFRK